MIGSRRPKTISRGSLLIGRYDSYLVEIDGQEKQSKKRNNAENDNGNLSKILGSMHGCQNSRSYRMSRSKTPPVLQKIDTITGSVYDELIISIL